MSFLHPETSEDEMAQVPFFCCLVPLVLVVGIAAFVIWRFA
jgi:hypothetical protein